MTRTALTDTVLGATSRVLEGAPWAPMRSAKYKVTSINAAPEPVTKGTRLTVVARIKVSDGTGVWRDAPRRTSVTVQHRAVGASSYRAVTTVRLATAGALKVAVVASTAGRWRVAVHGAVSTYDHVAVRS